MSEVISIRGKRILLVGCLGVLGRSYANALVAEGANVVIADYKKDAVMELAGELKVSAVEMDVGSESSVCRGVDLAANELGGLDGVIANSAITSEGLAGSEDAFAPLEHYPLEAWKRSIDINLTGTFLVSREAGRVMLDQGGGSIVTVSSIYGVVAPDHRLYDDQPFKSFPGYSASKAGVIGLTRWMSTYWASKGIRVNCLVPGGVFNQHQDSFSSAYANRTPMGRMADRNDMTGMLVYLLSDASSYCTGQQFIVDGGLTIW
jgi:NAD(P)-dependent dehydrogenase (short-subunit alcohol dehydrogenase family)